MDSSYAKQRDELKQKLIRSKYSGISFSNAEDKANESFKAKINEFQKCFPEEGYFNFRKYKTLVLNSELYNIIRLMPKGSLNHFHLVCHVNPEFNIDYIMKDLPHIYFSPTEKIVKKFPKSEEVTGDYKTLESQFDCSDKNKLLGQIRNYLYLNDEEVNDKTKLWAAFEAKLWNVLSLTAQKNKFYQFLIKSFKDALDHGILNVQARILFGCIFHDEELKHPLSLEEELDLYLTAEEEIKKQEPWFSFNIIPCYFRTAELDVIRAKLEETIDLINNPKYKNFVLGFDLVTDESLKESSSFSPLIHEYQQKHPNLVMFSHAGETSSNHNDNLIDNLMLKTARIGHATNLIKQSYMYETIKEKEICIEVNPISNQLLGYITDLRNHPLKSYLDYGIKVSISSDDDGFFDTDIISLDFACSSICLDFDLYDLKQVCYNSIKYSCIENSNLLLEEWKTRWNTFISKLV